MLKDKNLVLTREFNRDKAFLFFMLMLIVSLTIIIITSGEAVQSNPVVIISFVINILISINCLMLAIKEHSFSFNMMFWLFNLFFFGIAPTLQYLTDIYSWNLDPTDEELIKANILISSWMIFYILGRKISLEYLMKVIKNKNLENLILKMQGMQKQNEQRIKSLCSSFCVKVKTCVSDVVKKRKKEFNCPETGNVKLRNNDLLKQYFINFRGSELALNCFVCVSILMTIFYVLNIGAENLFFRSTYNLNVSSKTGWLLITHGFNNTILFTAVFSLIEARNKKRVTIRVVLAVVCLLLGCFPFALPRNMMAAFYGGLFVVLFEKTKKGRWFSLFILFALVIMFPAVEIFRVLVSSDIAEFHFFQIVFENIKNAYLQPHYDAHQMIISIMQFVEENGFAFFRQIGSVLLFFVPRSIWPSKSYGTGQTVFEAMDQYWYTNVSAPLVAEMYVSFGFLFVVFVGFLAGKLIKKIDNIYWGKNYEGRFIQIIYPFTMFMFFFMLRGDLMTSWAYTIAQIIVGFCITKCVVNNKVG